MFTIIDTLTPSRNAIAAAPTYATLLEAHANVTPGMYAIRTPAPRDLHATISVFHDADLEAVSAIGARVTIGKTAIAKRPRCAHPNVAPPMIASVTNLERVPECIECGAIVAAAPAALECV